MQLRVKNLWISTRQGELGVKIDESRGELCISVHFITRLSNF